MELKKCNKCNEMLPLDRFRQDKRPERKGQYGTECKDCRNKRHYAKYHAADGIEKAKSLAKARKRAPKINEKRRLEKEQNPGKIRDARLRHGYGITLEHYNKMHEKQEHKCAICEIPAAELKRPLFVDHCHKTGDLRGLLCGRCNTAIGMFKENTLTILTAATYLQFFNHDRHKKTDKRTED